MIGNIIALLSTFTVITAINVIIIVEYLYPLLFGRDPEDMEKAVVVVLSLVVALALIPFYYYPY
jgi:O-antigen/teichoic acid export membrane protein